MRARFRTPSRSESGLLLLLAGCAAVANAAPRVAASILAAAPANDANAYWVPEEFQLLYLTAPLVVTASFVWFLTPGLISAALARPRGGCEWAILAFGLSVLFAAVLPVPLKLMGVFGPGALSAAWAVASAGALALVMRSPRDAVPLLPIAPGDVPRLLAPLAAGAVAVALLVPKLFWEDFNLDGVEAFEFGRSLDVHWLPHWDLGQGSFGFYPNFFVFSYPNHWFINLFGPIEAAVRLPFLLYVSLLYLAILWVVESGPARRLAGSEGLVLGLGLVCVATTQVFNASYEPFYSDVAETAATDALWVLSFVAALGALLARRTIAFFAFGFLSYAASPGALLLLLGLGAAVFVFPLPGQEGAWKKVLLLFAACVAFALAHSFAVAWGVPDPAADQFSSYNLLRRLYPPTPFEFHRWSAMLIPTGLLPALSLAIPRPRRNPLAWALSVITLGYFATIYLQAWTSLHQFTPAMVLPLIVFWRLFATTAKAPKPGWLAATALAAAACAFLSLPRHFETHRGMRELGEATNLQIGDADRGYREALAAAAGLYEIFPEDYRLLYPDQPRGSDAAVFAYYALLPKRGDAQIRYAILPLAEPPPPGAVRLGHPQEFAVYTFAPELLAEDQRATFPRVFQSPVYEPIFRTTIRFFGRHAGQGVNELSRAE
jgi:hypothetical protein